MSICRNPLLLFSLWLLAAGCNRTVAVPAPEAADAEATVLTRHSARTSLDYTGTYAGVVPMADGPGQTVVIELTDKDRYVRVLRVLEEADAPRVDKGTFIWDSTGSIIQLLGIDAAAGPTRYRVQEDALQQLDLNGRPITGTLAPRYLLHKVPEALTTPTWTPVRLDTTQLSRAMTKGGAYVQFQSSEGRVVGFGGCNRFSSNYQARTDGSLDVSLVVSTKALCPEAEVERTFFRVLERADRFRVQSDTLYLENDQDDTIGIFVPKTK